MNINSVINYVLFGIWSFCQVLEYKYYTRVEQYETIVENAKACKREYTELLLKMAQLEARIAELSLPEEKLSLEDESIVSELSEAELKEVEQMANEDLEPSVVTSKETDLGIDLEPSVDSDLDTEAETKVDSELVDISEETYPVKQQKKKGWLKTILFM